MVQPPEVIGVAGPEWSRPGGTNGNVPGRRPQRTRIVQSSAITTTIPPMTEPAIDPAPTQPNWPSEPPPQPQYPQPQYGAPPEQPQVSLRPAMAPDAIRARPVRRRSRASLGGARPGVRLRALVLFILSGALGVFAWFLANTQGLSFATPAEAWTSVGDATGVLTGYALLVQVLLMARVPWLERGIGSDRLTVLHRVNGEIVVVMLLTHVGTVLFGYSGASWSAVPGEIGTLVFHTAYILPATIALAIFALTGLISPRRIRRLLPYELWYYLHLGVYAAAALAYAHQIVLGPTFEGGNTTERYLWGAAYSLVAALVLVYRVGGPLRLAYRHRLRVADVRSEGTGAVSIYITGQRLGQLKAEPGQFFRWRFLSSGTWWQAHPFSLSAAPNREWLRITVGGLGDHSSGLRNLQPGTRVIAEGPYGAFTAALRTRGKTLLLAGGIGVTPLRALVDALASASRDVVLVYRASDLSDVVLAEELDWLARAGRLKLHYLLGPRDSDPPPLSARRLAELVPDIGERDVFVCGPNGMIDAARTALKDAGVPRGNIHHERFAM